MKTRPSKTLLLAALVFMPIVGYTQSTISWSGGGGVGNQSWTNGSNWTGGNPPLTTDRARFSNVTNRTINVNGPQTVLSLLIADFANAYVFSGDQLTLTSAATGVGLEALELGSSANLTLNNAVHFSSGAVIDPPQAGNGIVKFNSTVTSAGNINFLARDVNNPFTVEFNGNVTLNSGAGNLILESGNIAQPGNMIYTLAGTNSFNSVSMVRSSTLKLASDGAISAGSTVVNNGGNQGYDTSFEAVGAARTYAANFTLNSEATHASVGTTIFTGSHDLTFTGTTLVQRNALIQVDGAIRAGLTGNWTTSGNQAVTKNGTGTLIMGSGGTTTVGHNLGTTINAGTLLVNGNMGNVSGTSDIVTVNNNGTLGGTGFIVRETTVNSGGIIAAGDSAVNNGVGTLTFSSGGGNFIGLSGARFQFDLNGTGTTHDRLNTNGGLALGTGNTFTFDFNNLGIGSYAANTWTTVWSNSAAWGANFTSNTFAFGTLTGGLSGGEFQLSGNDLQVRFTAIPEPSTWGMLLAASLGLIIFLRRSSSRRA